MKKTLTAAAIALALSASAAFAADMAVKAKAAPPPPPSPWDFAFGGALMSDYNFRGISQSDRGPGVFGYVEPRYNITKELQIYAGVAGASVKLPTTPTAEIDLYGGIRPTLGPVAFDFGAIYYWYPKERQIDGVNVIVANGALTFSDSDFWEVYGKASATVVPDMLTVGANVYYAWNWLNTGATGLYASGTAKVTLPGLPNGWGWYASGELGHYWIGTTRADAIVGPSVDLPDYTTWNVGLGVTYKVFTLDLRYYDTNLSQEQCFALTGDPGAPVGVAGPRSNWCSAAFVAKFSWDLGLDNLK